MPSSSAARVKLWCRAAASKTRTALMGGSLDGGLDMTIHKATLCQPIGICFVKFLRQAQSLPITTVLKPWQSITVGCHEIRRCAPPSRRRERLAAFEALAPPGLPEDHA